MAAQKWWVIKAFAAPGSTGGVTGTLNPSNGPVPTYQVVEGATKPNPSLIETFQGTTPVVTGPFPTKAAAQATIPKGAATGSGGPAGPGGSYGIPGVNVTGWETALGNFLGNLENANLWLRIGEGLLGVILIAVGVARMTNAVGAATKIASVVK